MALHETPLRIFPVTIWWPRTAFVVSDEFIKVSAVVEILLLSEVLQDVSSEQRSGVLDRLASLSCKTRRSEPADKRFSAEHVVIALTTNAAEKR